MNDLPKCINNISIPISFADDISILFTHSNITKFNVNIHTVLDIIHTWFKEKFLSLNFEKTHFIHFRTRNSTSIDLEIGCDNNLISNALHTKFLGLTIDSMISWRTHIDQLIIKLNTACYVIRSFQPYMSHKTLSSIYHSLYHCHEL
jgi:hypothetical protein